MTAPDLAVIGGGPSGLVTAINARLAGLSVRLFEQRQPPIDKACGEGLMPDGVICLEQLGVDALALGRPFGGVTFIADDRVAFGRFGRGWGVGVRRTTLHRALVDRAADLGVDLQFGIRVRGLSGTRVVTAKGAEEAGWIVGADGLHSRVRRWLDIASRSGRPRFGLRKHFRIDPWSDVVEIFWASDCEAYVTPVGDRLVGVAMLWGGGTGSFESLLQRFPDLRRRLTGASVASSVRGHGPLWSVPAAVSRGRVALVGDAAGYLDAITGEGLSVAFHQARAVVQAIVAGDLDSYRAAVRRLARWPSFMTRGLLFAERRPWLRRRLIATLAGDPELFSRLLAVHARQLTPGDLGLRPIWRLVRGLSSPGREPCGTE